MTKNMTMTMTLTMGLRPCFTMTSKIIQLIKMEETKPSAPLLYLNIDRVASQITSFSEQYIIDKILAKINLIIIFTL